MTKFDNLKKALASAASHGYADDAAVGDSIGLYDSDTGRTLHIEKRVVLTVHGSPVSLVYTTAKRGRICQVRRSVMQIHYFIDEPGAQEMIDENEARYGVTLAQILANAPDQLGQRHQET